MSSRGAHREEEEEDFYDCQDSMETKEEEEKEEKEEEEEEELPKTDRIIGRGAKERKRWTEGEGDERERQEEEELQQEEELQEEEELQQEEELQEEEERQEEEELQEEEESQVFQDSDEETSRVEFDDVYLREVEKELTEEEKESRRQQSVALKETGNGLFKAGDWKEAELSYTQALALCPVSCSRERAVMFSNRAAARMHLDLKDEAISDCCRAIDLDPEYLRALLRRAELYEKSEKLDEALDDYKKVLERDPSHSGAQQACMRLPQQIEERNEKLKEEMMGKLKDLGNLILRPFGLSTNNFQIEQDSSSGTFSINFVQNPNNNHTG